MSIFDLLHPDDLEHTRAGFELTQVGQPALRFVNRYRCKDGRYRWISWIGIPEEGYVYCTGRDVTAERDAEIELAAAQEALRHSQKMDAIGQLTGGIAHDFNNLLTGIIGSLDIVRRRMASGRLEEISHFMDAASTSAQKAGALTHRLLAFARRQPLDIRPNNINRLVDGMEDLLRRTLGEHIELERSLSAELWTALTDANQLESAVLTVAKRSSAGRVGYAVSDVGEVRLVSSTAGGTAARRNVRFGQFRPAAICSASRGARRSLVLAGAHKILALLSFNGAE